MPDSIASDPIRIAMWSGARNLSTALMRAFENRADCVVFDEPFYAHYLDSTQLEHPVAQLVKQVQPTDWRAVVADLNEPLAEGASLGFQKQKAHHLTAEIERDWMLTLRNGFLIRDPRQVLACYTKQREEVGLDDLGLRQQLELHDWLTTQTGTAPPVVDSRDLQEDPRGQLSKLCAALGIDFDEAMLTWPAGRRDSDGVWASWWYDKVMRSTGFKPFAVKRARLDGSLAEIAAAAMPLYEELRSRRLW